MVSLDQDSFLPLHNKLHVKLSNKRVEVSEKTEDKVSQIWQDALPFNSGLFDGKILAIDSCEKNDDFTQLGVSVVPYRYYWAILSDAEIASELNLMLLAVSGICVLEGRKVLLGIRSDITTQYPGCYELVPSGGVTPSGISNDEIIDYKGAFYTELSEETQISSDLVDYLHVLGFYIDSKGKTLDICLECGINSKASKLLNWPQSNEEYIEIDWIEGKNIIDLSLKGEQFVPASVALAAYKFSTDASKV